MNCIIARYNSRDTIECNRYVGYSGFSKPVARQCAGEPPELQFGAEGDPTSRGPAAVEHRAGVVQPLKADKQAAGEREDGDDRGQI